jgi:hypothetical protein
LLVEGGHLKGGSGQPSESSSHQSGGAQVWPPVVALLASHCCCITAFNSASASFQIYQ